MNNIFHVIKDPVHGTMQFTSAENGWVKPFIDSVNFQRLRHIKQLGMGDYIFPGAVHTRFNHSLGCCYVGSQIAQKIGLDDDDRQLVVIACLLHDIGHGPFSHAFEGVFHDKLIRHELWTPYFLEDYATHAFFVSYNQQNPRHRLTEEKFSEIASMIMHKPVKRRVLADIVSSQLDADRMDYLLRDSHFCGVRYSEFDFRWMLHCMTVVNAGGEERLGITYKGVGVTEHYLMARRLLTRNICHLQKKLALEDLLVLLLANLAESLEFHAPFKSIANTRLGEFLMAANRFNQAAEKGVSEKLIKQFLEANYATYKNLCDYDVYALISQLSQMCDSTPAIEIATRLQHRIIPKTVRLDVETLDRAEAELMAFRHKHHKKYEDWQLRLIKSPHQSYSGEDDPILVVNEHGSISTLGDYSIMIDAMSDRLEHSAFLMIDQPIAEEKDVQQLITHLVSSPKAAAAI